MTVALAVVVGLTSGGAFIVGGLARSVAVQSQVDRLAHSAAGGFSEKALEGAVKDPAALAVARAHDPYIPAAAPQIEREDRLAAFTDGLQARHGAATDETNLRLAGSDIVAPDRPFRLRVGLDQTRDLECLTQAVYYEARGESADGEAAVAQVVLNRTRHPAFPKSVCGVVYQGASVGGCQFSFACDGSVRHHVEGAAWRRAEKIAERALHGFVMVQVRNATHFHVADLNPDWGARLLKVAQVGAHVFYRFGPHGNAAPAAPAPTVVKAAEPLAQPQPVYASLSLAPLASSVANTVANSMAGAAELVKAAAAPKALAAAHAPEAGPAHGTTVAEPVSKPAAPAPAPAAAAPAPALAPTPVAVSARPAEAAAKPTAS